MASTASHIATDAGAATAAQADTQQTQPVPQTTTAATATPQICEFFLRDVCRFGERCRNVHPQPAKVETVQSAAGRLRPAHDVIARLQWDACMTSPATTTTTDGDISVEETQPRLQHVTVGYLDRFEGMQEVPFAQFNWSAELADAEEDELCIPRHRIWYFKYRGRLMWDRRSRVDQVFGGQRLETFVEMCDQAAAKQAEEVEAAEAAAATATAMDTAGDETPAGPALAAKSDVVVVAVPLTMGAADRLTAAQAAVLTRHPELALHQTPAADFSLDLLHLRLSTMQQLHRLSLSLLSFRPQLPVLIPPDARLDFTPTICTHHRKTLALPLDAVASSLLAVVTDALRQHLMTNGVEASTITALTSGFSTRIFFDLPSDAAAHAASQPMELQPMYTRVRELRLYRVNADGTRQPLFSVPRCPPAKGAEEVVTSIVDQVPCDSRQVDQRPHLVVMRGLSGSGKSSFVRKLRAALPSAPREAMVVCSADHFYERLAEEKQSTYRDVFHPSLLSAAHAACGERLAQALAGRAPLVILDNTNSTLKEYADALAQATAAGYTHTVVEFQVSTDTQVQLCAQRNTHRVPLSSLRRMLSRWQPDPQAVLVECWPHAVHVSPETAVPQRRRTPATAPPALTPDCTTKYIAALLTPSAMTTARVRFPPKFANVKLHHMTLRFAPSALACSVLPVGQSCTLEVDAEVSDNCAQALKVRYGVSETGVACANRTPHITVSVGAGINAVHSNITLASAAQSDVAVCRERVALGATLVACVAPETLLTTRAQHCFGGNPNPVGWLERDGGNVITPEYLAVFDARMLFEMSESGTVMPGPDLAVARSMSSTANGEIAVVFDKDGATDQIRQWCQKFNLAVDQFVAQSSALWNSIFGPDRAAGAKVTVGLASLLALGLDSTEFPPAWQAPSEFPMGPLEAFVAKCGWHSPGQQSAADAAVTTLQELWQQWCEKRPSRIFSTVCATDEVDVSLLCACQENGDSSSEADLLQNFARFLHTHLRGLLVHYDDVVPPAHLRLSVLMGNHQRVVVKVLVGFVSDIDAELLVAAGTSQDSVAALREFDGQRRVSPAVSAYLWRLYAAHGVPPTLVLPAFSMETAAADDQLLSMLRQLRSLQGRAGRIAKRALTFLADGVNEAGLACALLGEEDADDEGGDWLKVRVVATTPLWPPQQATFVAENLLWSRAAAIYTAHSPNAVRVQPPFDRQDNELVVLAVRKAHARNVCERLWWETEHVRRCGCGLKFEVDGETLDLASFAEEKDQWSTPDAIFAVDKFAVGIIEGKTFELPPSLTPGQRRVAHARAHQWGLRSASHGEGDQRRLVLSRGGHE